MGVDLSNYVDVAERLAIFREKYAEGSLQSEVEFVNGGVLCKAWAYRSAGDERPGVGHSFLSIPGTTPYTRGSEVENAETSAWGRAIVAALAADTKRVASADEIRNKVQGSVDGGLADKAAAGTGAANNIEWVWPTGKHKGKTIADTDLDYVQWYADNGPRDDIRQRCNDFLGRTGMLVGAGTDEADDIPFAPTIDGLQ